MKKWIALISVITLLVASLSACGLGSACEHCGSSAMFLNTVGDSVDGIQICNDCVEKMTSNRLSFTFTCDGCQQEKLGKKNSVEIDGQTKIICNTCHNHYQENGALPNS